MTEQLKQAALAALNACERIVDQEDSPVQFGIDFRALGSSLRRALTTSQPAQDVDVLERCAQWCDEQASSDWHGRKASDMVRAFASLTAPQQATPEPVRLTGRFLYEAWWSEFCKLTGLEKPYYDFRELPKKQRLAYENLAQSLTATHPAPGVPDVPPWQPIETAPKDGTIVDLWALPFTGSALRLTDVWWTERTGWRNGACCPRIAELAKRATHWTRPPAAPPLAAAQAKGDAA